jgi:hypothetical protein
MYRNQIAERGKQGVLSRFAAVRISGFRVQGWDAGVFRVWCSRVSARARALRFVHVLGRDFFEWERVFAGVDARSGAVRMTAEVGTAETEKKFDRLRPCRRRGGEERRVFGFAPPVRGKGRKEPDGGTFNAKTQRGKDAKQEVLALGQGR